MAKTKEISKSFSRKETIKKADGSYISIEHRFGKTIELEDGDVEVYEKEKLSKECQDAVNKEFNNT